MLRSGPAFAGTGRPITTSDAQTALPLPATPTQLDPVQAVILQLLSTPVQPSARELLASVEEQLGVKARWDVLAAVELLANAPRVPRVARNYLQSLLATSDLQSALRGEGAPEPEAVSSIDSLLQQGRTYRESAAFRDMIDFMGRFRDYAPYNNMLVRLQNPACSFFATEKHWRQKFDATLKEDARPMLILAPMTPVLLVYDIDQVQGADLPAELERFATFEGRWNPSWLDTVVKNAQQRDRIQVGFKPLSSTLAGYATLARGGGHWKRRIAIHAGLDGPSRFGVLCHELAHIYLGHLGADDDHWWPSRTNLTRHAVELEAEAVAHLVTRRFGLDGASSAYVSRHMPDGQVPTGVSMDLIAKVAGRIEQMAQRKLPRRAPRPQRKPKR